MRSEAVGRSENAVRNRVREELRSDGLLGGVKV
jgi:hypothetical protein